LAVLTAVVLVPRSSWFIANNTEQVANLYLMYAQIVAQSINQSIRLLSLVVLAIVWSVDYGVKACGLWLFRRWYVC